MWRRISFRWIVGTLGICVWQKAMLRIDGHEYAFGSHFWDKGLHVIFLNENA
jgi:hypothetical protein